MCYYPDMSETTKSPSLACGICGSGKHSAGYTDNKTGKTHYALVCPRCDWVNRWPRAQPNPAKDAAE